MSEPDDRRWHLAHERVVHAPPDAAWAAVHAVRLCDLRVGRLLVAVRYLGRPHVAAHEPLLTAGPMTLLEPVDARAAVSGLVSQPWRLRPRRHPVATLAELEGFDTPGWVKIRMDVNVAALPRGRSRITTSTTVTATDRRARMRFWPYWILLRPFLGLLRRDVLAAVARRCQDPPTPG